MDEDIPSLEGLLEQVHHCLQFGQPQDAYQILCGIPPVFDVSVNAAVAAEKQACLLAMDKQESGSRHLLLFNASLMLFYQITEILPDHEPAYTCQAEFWRRIGNPDMATRLMRTLAALLPERRLNPAEDGADVSTTPSREECRPEWNHERFRPAILFITPARPHYGLDVLYDGLCSLLGDERVVDYPWKPTLHGAAPSELAHYPCAMNRPGQQMPLEQVLSRLKEKAFDLILLGDIDGETGWSTIRALAQASGGTPWFLVDALDECADYFPQALSHLDRANIRGCFKREMLACVDYVADRGRIPIVPLPFAYPDHRVAAGFSEDRPRRFFWAGQRWCGLRNLYLKSIEQMLGETFTTNHDQEDYVRLMRDSRMGLCGFGAGFDTARYWELPANGCLLFAERSPLRIPDNFADGESAVFFDDLPDLEKKFRFYLDHPDAAATIARAGHEHLKKYHTASARARYALGWMQEILDVRP